MTFGRGSTALVLILTIAVSSQAIRAEEGYRTGAYRAPTPEELSGAEVVDTRAVETLWHDGETVFIDVLPHSDRPVGLPEDTYWRPTERSAIPGSVWLPNTGYAPLAPEVQDYFEAGLTAATEGERHRPLVFYCLRDCWMSWNAAKRALEAGYRRVYWYPDGTDGWTEAGLPLETVTPWRPNTEAAD